MITVIGIFADIDLAEQASEYLLSNEFEPENVDVHTQGTEGAETDRVGNFFGHIFDDNYEAEHYATLGRNGTVITVHAVDTREAQEAVDVFNNHGAIEVGLDEQASNRTLVLNKLIEYSKRLRN